MCIPGGVLWAGGVVLVLLLFYIIMVLRAGMGLWK